MNTNWTNIRGGLYYILGSVETASCFLTAHKPKLILEIKRKLTFSINALQFEVGRDNSTRW